MTIGGIGSTTLSQLSSTLFSKLDTKQKGYVEKSDLDQALAAGNSAGASGSTDSTALFNALDTDGDGKVTQSELASGLQTLADKLLTNLRSSGHHGRADGPPPGGPPPASDGQDGGFTKDELTQMASDASGNSRRSSFMSKLADNFDAADTDGNGRIDRKEARAFAEQSHKTGAEGSTAGASSNDSATGLMQLVRLLAAYGVTGDSSGSSTGSTLTATA